MKGRRNFLKTAGIGAAGLILTPWNNLMDSQANQLISVNPKGSDLTDPKNASILEQWGYLNILTFGADPTGIKDSTAAIQKAIDESTIQEKGVLIPAGTYIISDTLRCYKTWAIKDSNTSASITPFPRNCFIIMGDPGSKKRPLFRLSADAKKFDDAANPQPMIAFANFQTDRAWTKEELKKLNPIKVPLGVRTPPGGVVNRCMAVFDDYLGGIDFDCSGHPGAVGIFFPSAQKAVLINVKVNAENAHTGIWGIPGRNSGAMNIEIQGGKIGLNTSSALAGTTIVGLTLHDQTDHAFVSEDFVPACVVGFHITKKSAPVITLSGQPYDLYGGTEMMTAKGTMVLIDGMIEVEETKKTVPIDNKAGKSFYARNVYVKGSNDFIQSGPQKSVSGTGEWYQVQEYCFTDQRVPKDDPPYEIGDLLFPVYNVIDGVVDRKPEPSVVTKNNINPPADLILKHLFTNIPQVSFSDTSKTRNIMQSPYNAVPDGRDNWEAIQRAVDDAEKDGGIVYIPKGTFLISRTLTLRSKSKLTGLGTKRSADKPLAVIGAHPTWLKPEINSALIQTVDDPEAEPYLGFMNLLISKDIKYHIHWRAGRKSTMMNLGFDAGASSDATIYITGNGGGRYYFLEPQSSAGKSIHRHVKIEGTRQPLSWYGCNLEAGKGLNMELTDAQNIRIYGIKREGHAETFAMTDCLNVAIYAQGAMRQAIPDGSAGFFQIKGSSDNILMGLAIVQTIQTVPNNTPLLAETINGKEKVIILYPESVSLYKRGTIDDLAMERSR